MTEFFFSVEGSKLKYILIFIKILGINIELTRVFELGLLAVKIVL